jgi:serine/threonine protein kinase
MIDRDDEIEKKLYFHKYKPEKKIGEGSFGKIYSAVNIQTNERYALKMVISIMLTFPQKGK